MTLSIRRAASSDAAALARHLGDLDVLGGTLRLPYPSLELWQKRMSDQAAVTNGDVVLIAERDGEFLGHASLNAIGTNVRRRHAVSLCIAVSTAAHGQGVGTALMAALCDYADRWLGVLRIELLVYADNEAAIRLYRKFGFELEGTMRAHALRDGVYVDSLAMARLHPSPPTLPPR